MTTGMILEDLARLTVYDIKTLLTGGVAVGPLYNGIRLPHCKIQRAALKMDGLTNPCL